MNKTKINDGGPAYPERTWEYDGQNNVLPYDTPGITYRQALVKEVAGDCLKLVAPEYAGVRKAIPEATSVAIAYADALIAAEAEGRGA